MGQDLTGKYGMSIPTPTVTEEWDQRTADIGDDGYVVYNRGFTVNFGSTTGCTSGEMQTLEGVVATAVGINRWDSHPAEPRATCRTLSIRPHDGPHVWQAIYNYTSKPVQGKEGSETTGPSKPGNEQDTPAQSRPPTLSVGKRIDVKPLILDFSDPRKPVVNSVCDPFDPPVEYEVTNPTFTWKFFRLPADLAWSTREAFIDTVNDRSITILGKVYEAGLLRCTSVQTSMVWDNGTSGALKLFFEITVEWEHKRGGWQAHIVDAGRRFWFQEGMGDPEWRKCIDATGADATDPMPLNGAGVQVNPVDLPAGIVYLDFIRYPESNLANVLA